MGDGPEPGTPVVTVRGGPAPPAPRPPRPPHPARLPLLLGLAALAAVVAGTRGGQPAPAAPDAADPVVIGAALPLTGVLAPFGRAQQRGVQHVLDGVADDGGVEVGGERRLVQLVVRDTGSVPDVAGQQALILARGPFRLTALLGPCAPPVAMVRVAESRQVPLLTGCQPLPEVGPTALDHTWQVAPADADRAAAVFTALGAATTRRVALFLSNDRSEQVWTVAAERAGFTVAGPYRPQGRDWSRAVARAAADGAPQVVAVTQAPDGVALWGELRAQGVRPQQAYVSEAGLGSAWYAAVGRARAEGTLTDALHPPSSGRGSPGPGGADEAVAKVSAELTRVLLDGLRRAGSAERGAVNDALAGARGSVAGGEVRFDGAGTSRVPHRLARWSAGRLVPLPPAR